jgi:hypothetical protein
MPVYRRRRQLGRREELPRGVPSVCDWITVLGCLFQYVRLESNVFVVLRDAADQKSEAGDPRHAVELYETLADDLRGAPQPPQVDTLLRGREQPARTLGGHPKLAIEGHFKTGHR